MYAQFVMARNAHGRPTLQHKVSDDYNWTKCGVNTSGWSKLWQSIELDILLCRRCKAIN